MRAGNLDIVIQTGALWTRDIQVLAPDTAIEVQAVTPGMRIFVDGRPSLVHSVTPSPGGRTTIVFGHGLINDPVASYTSTSLVAPAVPVELLEVAAAFFDDTDPVTIPSTISADGLTATLTIPAVLSQAMSSLTRNHSWDCYVRTAAWDWQRILEGTLSIIRGDAR